MPESIEALKLRLLICFLKMSKESCTVTKLSQTLAVEKYSVSRAMRALEKEGLLDRSNNRCVKLTQGGIISAKKYADRMDMATNHLLYEGVPQHDAQADAMYLSMYCSDNTFQAIQEIEGRFRIRHVLKGKKNFDGAALCRGLRDGTYQIPFVIYRETARNGNNISMANEGFEHPGFLTVHQKTGMINLKAQDISHCSKENGKKMRGKITQLKYFNGNEFCDALKNGDALSFPADSLQFCGFGEGSSKILHGSVLLKMRCSVGVVHMPESTAIFTVLL